MSVVDTAKMAWVAAREGGRLAGDALGDLTGTQYAVQGAGRRHARRAVAA